MRGDNVNGVSQKILNLLALADDARRAGRMEEFDAAWRAIRRVSATQQESNADSGATERVHHRARGEGRVFRRGKKFWIQYYGPRDGRWQQIRESSKSVKESDAEKILRNRLREVANHRGGVRTFQGPAQERVTVDNLIDSLVDDYGQRGIKSLRRSINHAKSVREFFGHYRAVAVTSDLIRSYIELRRGEGASPATINRGCEILSAAFGLAVKEGKLAAKPYIPHLPERNARTGFFEAAEHELMLKHLASPMDNVARLAYVCGWRKEEIRTLTWANVDREAKEVRLCDSKNGEGRVLPLDEDTWRLFGELWTARQYQTASGPALSEFVFHRDGRPVGEANFEKLWRSARTRAGLPSKLFHDYRRTAARNMIRAGVPQSVAMAITGHKTDSMFRRYNIVSSDDKREALEKQFEYLKARPSTTNVSRIRRGSGPDRGQSTK